MTGETKQKTNSWVGIKVKDNRHLNGVIIADDNAGYWRHLTIKFSDGERYILHLNNVRKDAIDKYGIQWEYNPGQWGYISDNPQEKPDDDPVFIPTAKALKQIGPVTLQDLNESLQPIFMLCQKMAKILGKKWPDDFAPKEVADET